MKPLPYPALYVRMALYIGAALSAFVLIGAFAFASIAAWELQGYVQTRESDPGRAGAAVLAAEGRSGLVRWLQDEAAVPEDAIVYVFDETGDDILGRPIPEMYRSFVESVAADKEAADDNFLPVRLISQAVAPDGRVYSFLPVPRNITLFGSIATGLGVLGAALLVIASVAWLIAGRIGRPIRELQQAVRNLAAGDNNARVPGTIARRTDELGQLAHDFNAMADHLNQLIESHEQLMSELSHELRSPLTRLQAAISLAARRDTLADDERARIEKEIATMDKVIGEILRYSALDSAIGMRIRLVRLDKLLATLVETEEIEAKSRGCKLRLDADRNLEVAGDRDLLNSAFENVLRNAIRYAPEHSKVKINATRRNGDVSIEVCDRGPGVAPDKLERIFRPLCAGCERQRRHRTGTRHRQTRGRTPRRQCRGGEPAGRRPARDDYVTRRRILLRDRCDNARQTPSGWPS